ncbi:winged helix-turn-helix domain-containing protein [Candidatus Pelagibacter sp.]|nr:winged helix-turn-helix domain-containing protein [Candidatus Pelagibacter sp.]
MQNVFIINYNSLYEILNEIKDNLSFSIKNYNNEDDFLRESGSNLKNSLIISKLNNKLFFNKNLNDTNFFDLSLFPIPLIRLVELINIQLIKLKFNKQSKVNIKGYDFNLNSKFISKDNTSLKLTEKEIDVILYLNETNLTHSILDLQNNIWRYSPGIETHTVETHIYRIKQKFLEKFEDRNFIISKKSGYQIK